VATKNGLSSAVVKALAIQESSFSVPLLIDDVELFEVRALHVALGFANATLNRSQIKTPMHNRTRKRVMIASMFFSGREASFPSILSMAQG
jgi:hypothetical protein